MRAIRVRSLQRNYGTRMRPLILLRDRYVCRLCGRPIDPSLPRTHPMAGTVDHIVPLGKGGTSDEFNLQAAHAACNHAKSCQPKKRR